MWPPFETKNKAQGERDRKVRCGVYVRCDLGIPTERLTIMLKHTRFETVVAVLLAGASMVACGASSSQSAAETAPSKEMDSAQTGGETAPDGTSTADDQPSGTHTMPDGTTMSNDEMKSD